MRRDFWEHLGALFESLNTPLMWGLILCMVMLAVLQLALINSAWWPRVSPMERGEVQISPSSEAHRIMEGYSEPSASVWRVSVLVEGGQGYGRVHLLVNGQRVADFGKGWAWATVSPGDLVEIDGYAYRGDLVFRVIEAPPGQQEIKVGQVVVTSGTIARLGLVR